MRAEVRRVLETSQSPKCNINKEERADVKDLKNNDTIIILPADKGKATMVMDVEEYENMVGTMLSDEKT